MQRDSYALVLSCQDGRSFKRPVRQVIHTYLEEQCNVRHILDRITEPGIDGILSDRSIMVGPIDLKTWRQLIWFKIQLAIGKFGSPTTIAVIGHADCGGNPGDTDHHVDCVRRSIAQVAEWFPDVPIIGMFVDERGSVMSVDQAEVLAIIARS